MLQTKSSPCLKNFTGKQINTSLFSNLFSNPFNYMYPVEIDLIVQYYLLINKICLNQEILPKKQNQFKTKPKTKLLVQTCI